MDIQEQLSGSRVHRCRLLRDRYGIARAGFTSVSRRSSCVRW